MSCSYSNTLKAAFGRKISASEANEQFIAIEAAMACIEALAESSGSDDEENHNYGSVDTGTILDPSFGNLQYVTVESAVEMSFSDPDEEDPKVIYLLIADGGQDAVTGDVGDVEASTGTFKFTGGAVWSTDSNGAAIDGAPWRSDGVGGKYGSIVICIHDGIGWVYLVFARNAIDFEDTSDVTDLFNWR